MYMVRKLVPVIILPLLFVFVTPSARADDISMLEKGKLYFQTGHYYFATTWLERMLNNYPASPRRKEALTIMCRAYALSERTVKASRYLDILRREFPDAADSVDAEIRTRTLSESVPAPIRAAEPPPAPLPSSSVEPVKIPAGSAKPDQAPQPVPTDPSRNSAAPLSGPERFTANRVAPGPVTRTEGGSISRPAGTPVPITIPVAPPVAKPVVEQAAPVPQKGSEPSLAAAMPSPLPAPSVEENLPKQQHAFYTLSAGKTVSRSKLGILVKKLKAAGLQPVVREENWTVDVYRLVTECFSTRAAAQSSRTDLARLEKRAFIVHDAGQFCVAAASFFSYDAARTEQKRLTRKALRTEIVKARTTLTVRQVTAGRYDDSRTAAESLKSLAERGIDAVVVPLDK